MKWKVYFDSNSYPYIVEADDEETAIVAAANLYFAESGKKFYSYVEALPITR